MSSQDNDRNSDGPSDVFGEASANGRAMRGNPGDRKAPAGPTERRMRGNPGDRK